MTKSSIVSSRSFRVILLAFGQGMRGIINLLMQVALARMLIKTDYAVYIQGMLIITTLTPILALGLPTTMYIIMPRARQNKRTRAALLENQALLLGIGSAFAIFLWLGGNQLVATSVNSAPLTPMLLILAPYLIFSLPLLSLDSVLLVNGKPIQIVLFRIGTQMVTFITVVLAAVVWHTPEAVFLALTITSIAAYGVGSVLMWRSCDVDDFKPEWRSLRTGILLGLPLLLATSFGTLQLNLDTWLVSLLSTPEKLAVFAVGATELPLIGLFTAAITQVLLADCATLFREDRREEIARIIWQATRSNVIFLLPTMIFFLVTANSVVPFLYSNAYQESVYPFMLYLLVIPARFINYSSIEIASGKTQIVPIIFGINIVLTAIFTILLYPLFGYIGATYSYLLVTYIFAVPAHLYVFVRVLKLPLWKTFPRASFGKVLLSIGLASLALFADRLLVGTGDLARIGILAALFGIALVITFVILRVDIPLLKALLIFRQGRSVPASL